MIIDQTYFKGEISVPNNTVSNAELDLFISSSEAEILRKLLGDELYSDYLTNPTDAKWIALVEGETFINGDYTVIWKGLKNTELISLLAYFTYEKLARSKSSQLTSVGTTKGKSEKATKISESFKMSFANNRGVDLYGELCNPLFAPTAYNFLRYSSYDFTGWIFTPIERINQMGI